jgi:hypothetical protein
MIELKSQHFVAGLDRRHVNRQVGRRAGKMLNVDVFGAE